MMSDVFPLTKFDYIFVEKLHKIMRQTDETEQEAAPGKKRCGKWSRGAATRTKYQIYFTNWVVETMGRARGAAARTK